MTNNFDLYAQYYDLLYQNKNYSDEIDYVERLMAKYSSIKIANILDLGCGTGKHDFLLSEKGYKITGVDLSSQMIQIANRTNYPNIKFVLGDVRNINLSQKYDTVISLFHVACYQSKNIDFKNYLKTAYEHLEVGGLFIFDFWYGPGVITDKPTIRKKEIENDFLKITRISNPILFPNKNIVDVVFNVEIYDKIGSNLMTMDETHRMRYLFLPEIFNFAHQVGFSFLDSFEWMTDKDLGFDSWNGVVILKKTA